MILLKDASLLQILAAYSMMEYYCRQKFSNPELRRKLIAVEEPIVEDNWWNDIYWGVCNGIGENKLGQILTKIREEALEHMIIENKEE